MTKQNVEFTRTLRIKNEILLKLDLKRLSYKKEKIIWLKEI